MTNSVLIIGVGAFTHGIAQRLQDAGMSVIVWLNRDYGHYGAKQVSTCFSLHDYDSPLALLAEHPCTYVLPMSIDWAQQPWANALMAKAKILCPSGEALKLERDRFFAHSLCEQYGIALPKAYVAMNRIDAESFIAQNPAPYVLKNTLCSPTSPIHTIVCETLADTKSWLHRIDYAEGVYLQEYLGHREAGHIAFVQGETITPLITNQEYKRAFNGNMGKIAGAPLGGIVEQDPHDKYGLVAELIEPLKPWFKAVNYCGPVQVTAIFKENQWHVIEYNCRLGVTCGTMIMSMLNNPVDVFKALEGALFKPDFKPTHRIGTSVTLAGYGYPFLEVTGPAFPLLINHHKQADIWFNEVMAGQDNEILADGHRLLEVNAFGETVEQALKHCYTQLQGIHCSGSYYRTDIGETMWPPGSA